MKLAGTNVLSFESTDAVSGEQVLTTATREADGSWILQEITKSGNVSMFQIEADGQTRLTLDYASPHYQRLNANPGIVEATRYQDATVYAFNTLANRVLENNPNDALEKQKGLRALESATENIKSGQDEVGHMIYSGYKDSLTDPRKAVGEIAVVYQQAQGLKADLSETGNLNKLLTQLNTLYRLNGDVSYKPEVSISGKTHGVTDEKEISRIKTEAIRQKALEDLDAFADRFATKKVLGYIEAKAAFNQKEQEILGVLSKDQISRGDVRVASYAVEKAKLKLLRQIEIDSLKTGRRHEAKVLVNRLTNGWSYSKPVVAEDQASAYVESSKQKLLLEFGASKQTLYVDILSGMSPDSSEAFLLSIAKIDQQLDLSKKALIDGANASPDVVCKAAAKLKHLELQRKTEVARIRVSLAQSQVDLKARDWQNGRETAGDRIARLGLKGARQTGGILIDAGRSWLAANSKLLKEQFRSDVGDVLNRIKDSGDAKEDVVILLNEIDNRILGEIKSNGKTTIENIQWGLRFAREHAVKADGDLETGKIALEKQARIALHNAEISMREKITEAAVALRGKKIEAQIAIGAAIGGEAVRQAQAERMDRIQSGYQRVLGQKIQELRARPNKQLDYFTKDLEERVKFV